MLWPKTLAKLKLPSATNIEHFQEAEWVSLLYNLIRKAFIQFSLDQIIFLYLKLIAGILKPTASNNNKNDPYKPKKSPSKVS
jgi:hypothetical protein